jgi:arylsulfatase
LERAVKGCGWRAAGASEKFAPAVRCNGLARPAQRGRLAAGTMSSFEFWTTTLLCLVSVLGASVAHAQPTVEARPNILLILVDNLGYGELGSYGGGVLRGAPTPRLDLLATEGLRLTNFNVESQCTPSRSALLTGRFAIRSGTSRVVRGGRPSGLVQWEVTLAEVLSAQGYATAHYGKWHLGDVEDRFPTHQGFDEWYGISNTSHRSMYTSQPGFDPDVAPTPSIMEGRRGEPSRKVATFDLETRRLIDTEATRRAVAFMERNAQARRPFFAYVPLTAVHYPTLPHPSFSGKTGNGDFADSVVEMDAHVGELLDALKRLQLEANTIVIFASDNGPEDLLPWRGSAGPWSGSYFTAMEGSLRAPFIIRWPGRVPHGATSNEIVHQVDVFTTLARIVGADIPQDRMIDGVDQRDFFLGRRDRSAREGFPCYVGDTLAAAKWRNWKVHFVWQEYKFDPVQTLAVPRVFNLLDDPRERHDLSTAEGNWALFPLYKLVDEFQASLRKEPPIPVGTPDPYVPGK